VRPGQSLALAYSLFNMQEKIQKSKDLISLMLGKFKRPCLLWSGGKDSMVLLHLTKFELGLELPLVCWREPWMPWKQKFVNQVIQDWNLEVWDWAPSAVQLCQGNGRIDVLNHYQISPAGNQPDFLILARGTEPPVEGEQYLCGVETFLSRPVGTFNFPWDCLLHGHKSSDEDPTSGGIPLKTDVVQNPLSAAAIFPLRDWTDEDIFAYARQKEVPLDPSRYSDGKILKDKHFNPDYYPACFNCVEKGGPEFVSCPKYRCEMNNVSSMVSWAAPKASYCSLREDCEK